jgi:hypothetical protein
MVRKYASHSGMLCLHGLRSFNDGRRIGVAGSFGGQPIEDAVSHVLRVPRFEVGI